MLFILIAQLTVLSIMAVDDEWVSFALMFVLFLWSFFLGILNFYWIHVVRTHHAELSPYDSDVEEMDDDEDDKKRKPRGARLVQKI